MGGQRMEQQFTNDQLIQIIDEALIYMCACPAQVAKQLLELRKLYDYQMQCEADNPGQNDVHLTISRTTALCHAEMEQCLRHILEVEEWDMNTLKMPPGLRKFRDSQISNQ